MVRRKPNVRGQTEEEQFMDVEGVSRYLNLHIMTVYRMLQTRQLPARKIGGRWRINRRELNEWLERYTGGAQKLVLVVDDDPEIGDLFKRALRQERCSVNVVTTGEEALKFVKETTYDLIFLDLVLPKMDGAKVFSKIRKIDPDANVVLITAYPDSELVGKAMKHGAVSLLIKPLPVAEIRKLARSVQKRLPRKIS